MKVIKFFRNLLMMTFLLLCFESKLANAQESTVPYDGELGIFYTQTQTTFKMYSSSASSIKVVVEGIDNDRCPSGVCTLAEDGQNSNVWIGYAPGDLVGKEYSYIIEHENGEIYENVLDPYGKYLNDNGTKNVIYDDGLVKFDEWETQTQPLAIKEKNKIIYGLNINSFTSHASWLGTAENRGKLLGLIEENTKYNSVLTGYDYVKSLGITYIELSKVYDSDNPFSIDKSISVGTEYYSGSFELKKVVNGYYSNNIGIVITFDYRDLSSAFINNLYKIDKNVYLDSENNLNLSSEMVQNYIISLLNYLVSNYKLSGVRIENMSDFSVDFINETSTSLKNLNENILIYGDGSYDELEENNAGENNLSKLTDAKMLNGSLNYSLFGSLLNNSEKGILDGNYNNNIIETLKFTLLSSVDNGQIDYSLVGGISYKQYWGNTNSYQIVNYLGNKQGLSIYDKLIISNLTGENIIKQKAVLAFGTMMFSGGIPYVYSGNEFLASYLDVNNTEDSVCDTGNVFCFHIDEKYKIVDWSYAQTNSGTIDAFKSLINYRKSNITVEQTDSTVIKNNVEFYLNEEQEGVIGFRRKYPNAYVGELEELFVVLNYSNNDYTLENMKSKGWYGLYNYNLSNRDGDTIVLKANSIYSELKEKQPRINQWLLLIIVIGVIGLIYYANIVLNKRLVEKNGYDIKDINKKYRPFINKDKIKKNEENKEEKNNQDLVQKDNNDENKEE